jgi:hypothetical protein
MDCPKAYAIGWIKVWGRTLPIVKVNQGKPRNAFPAKIK